MHRFITTLPSLASPPPTPPQLRITIGNQFFFPNSYMLGNVSSIYSV